MASSVSNMKRGDLIELKSLHSPPQLVKNVLTSTLVLLGDSPKAASDWSFVRKALGKTSGKDSLLGRINNCDPEKITVEAKKFAQSQVAGVNVEAAKKVSASVASLAVWVKTVSADVEKDDKPKKS